MKIEKTITVIWSLFTERLYCRNLITELLMRLIKATRRICQIGVTWGRFVLFMGIKSAYTKWNLYRLSSVQGHRVRNRSGQCQLFGHSWYRCFVLAFCYCEGLRSDMNISMSKVSPSQRPGDFLHFPSHFRWRFCPLSVAKVQHIVS